MNDTESITYKYEKRARRRRIYLRILSVLMCVTVFCTVYMLMLPALTMEADEAALCGLISHTHGDECYENGVLVCTIPEHEHDMECFSETLWTYKYSCGYEYEHTHNEECYIGDVLVCSLTEHVHDENCKKIENPIQVKLRTLKLLAGPDIVPESTNAYFSWKIDASGNLSVYNGSITDEYRPWNTYKEQITSVTFTNIDLNTCEYLLYGLNNCTSIDLSGASITSQCASCFCMFYGCSSLTNVIWSTNIDTSNCTNFYGMFENCTSLENVDISCFDFSSCTDSSHMFQNCAALESLEMTNTSRAHNTAEWDASYMFYGCSSLESVDMSHIDTSTCSNMNAMFKDCTSLGSIDLTGDFSTENCKNMSGMFENCSSLTEIDLSNFDTSSVTICNYMFSECTSVTEFDISNFSFANCTNAVHMFENCDSAVTIAMPETFAESSLTQAIGMFYSCDDLTAIDLSTLDLSDCESVREMFADCASLESVVFGDETDLSACLDMSKMFANCGSLKSVEFGDETDVSACLDMSQMFAKCKSLESIDLSGFINTENVENFSSMFIDCESLISVEASGFVKEGAVDTSSMFSECYQLTVLDASGWNTQNVEDMSRMFELCEQLDDFDDVEAFDTSSVLDFSGMFISCGATELDLSDWNTENAIDMSDMFDGTERLTSLNINGFDTSNVESMAAMFSDCGLELIDLSSFSSESLLDVDYMFCASAKVKEIVLPDTFTCSNVYDFSGMFDSCIRLETVDVSHLDVSSAESLYCMFNGCTLLKEIDVSNFVFSPALYDMSMMFQKCDSLSHLDLSAWDTSELDADMTGAFLDIGTIYKNGAVITLGPDFKMSDWSDPFYDVDPYNYSEDRCNYYMKMDDDGTLDVSVRDYDGIAEYQSTSTENTDYVQYYAIEFDANGGNFSDDSDLKTKYYRIGEEWSFSDSTVPVKANYEFSGWDTIRSVPSSRIAEDDWKISRSFGQYSGRYDTPAITFYAEWAENGVTLDTSTDGIASVISTGDNDGDPIPGITFSFRLTSVEAYGPASVTGEAVTSGNGKFNIDFGVLEFDYPGEYHLEIIPTDPSEDGWVINKAPKIVTVTVAEENGVLTVTDVESVEYTNVYSWGKDTSELDADDKPDKNQKNYTVKEAKDILLKSAEWVNKALGQAEIRLIFNNAYGSSDATRAVYLFCNCEAHEFTQEIAQANIEFLIEKYDFVDVISLEDQIYCEGFAKHMGTFTKHSTSEEIATFLDSVKFLEGSHSGAMYAIDILTDYFDHFDPTSVYISFDGTRSFGVDGNPYSYTAPIFVEVFNKEGLGDYMESVVGYTDEELETIRKLAQYQNDGLYYLMTADNDDASYTYSYVLPHYDYYGDAVMYKNLLYHWFATVSPAVFVDEQGYEDITNIIDYLCDGIVNDEDLIAELFDENAEDAELNWKEFLARYSETYLKRVYSYTGTFEALGIDLPLSREFSIIDVIDSDWGITSVDDLADVRVGFYDVDADGNVIWKDYNDAEHPYELTVTIPEDGSDDGITLKVNFPVMNMFVPVVIRIPVVTECEEYYTNDDWFRATNIGDAYADVNWTFINSRTNELSSASSTSTSTSSPELFKKKVPAEKNITDDSEAGLNGEAVSVGDRITYEISFTNNKTSPADAYVTDHIPSGTVFVSGSDGVTYLENENIAVWQFSDVPAGEEIKVYLTVEVTEDALYTIGQRAEVIVGNETSELTLETPVAPRKVVSDDSEAGVDGAAVKLGDLITYKVIFTYKDGTVVTDAIPEGTEYVSAALDPNGPEGTASFDSISNKVTWTYTSTETYDTYVLLTVRVTDGSREKITNIANVAGVDTNEVENPLGGGKKITVYKYNDSESPLANVRFALYTSVQADAPEGAASYVFNGGSYYLIAEYLTGTDGTFETDELNSAYGEATYLIVEKAPLPGYIGLASPVAFTFDDSEDIVLENAEAGVSTDSGDTIKVLNCKGQEIPSTGGPGTKGFVIAACAIFAFGIIAAFTYLNVKRRKCDNER